MNLTRARTSKGHHPGPNVDKIRKLSPRQQEVGRMLAIGKTNHEIAAELGTSVKTIDTHRAHILLRLGLRNNVELARRALAEGFVTLEDE